jgi:hypothetical protein
MSGECDFCSEHALDCNCAANGGTNEEYSTTEYSSTVPIEKILMRCYHENIACSCLLYLLFDCCP